MNFSEAYNIVVQKRKATLDYAESLYFGALKNNPELLKIETALREISLNSAKGEKTDKTKIAALNKKKNDLLLSLGLDAKTLNPQPICALCCDTGKNNGEFCNCVKTLSLTSGNNIEIPIKNFKDIDFERFDPCHKERNKAVYEDVQKICERYPDNKRKTVLINGGTGTGKTLLASCCVGLFKNRGLAVTAVTAFGFVQRALKFHTAFDSKKLSFIEPLIDAELLVIDDLGTESILKNVTHEYLYTVLNERINKSRLTVITTNLSKAGITERYGERISSRLFDKTVAYFNTLGGGDLRKK